MDGVDECYVWERRILHGIRHQKAAPFPESVAIGLDFNAALERKEKLNPCLLTNGVMLELCDFTRTVTQSEKYFLFEVLDFNFDLGLDNSTEFYEYATRVHGKIKHLKELMKLKPHRWVETFPLPDPGVLRALELPRRYRPQRCGAVDVSVLTSRNRPENQARDGAASWNFILKRKGGFRLKRTGEVYPYCRTLGVSLNVRPNETPKQKLDPGLVTVGVMIELLDFSRAMCGTQTHMLGDLVRQNFGQELDKLQLRLQLNKLTEKRGACLTAEDRDAFRQQLFQVQKKKRERRSKKRKDDFQELEVLSSKRRGTRLDLSYMCPLDFEPDLQTESLSNVRQVDVSVSSAQLQNLPETRSPKTLLTSCDLFSEDEPEKTSETPRQKLWTRRAARSKEILRSSRVNDLFAHSRAVGLDFNVGSGRSQSLDLQRLTNWVVLEVLKFATALTKSSRSFLSDILGNNFSPSFQDHQRRRSLILHLMMKEKVLQNHPARQKQDFLSSPFQFPEVYHMVDVTSDFQTEKGPESGLSSAPNRQAHQDSYPFCQKLGLDLWSTEERPQSQKLDLTVLTTGAVLEVFHFTRQLCGSVRETVNDVLEHNFDLDLQNCASEASKVIQRWYGTQKILMKKQNMSPKVSRWLNRVVPLNGQRGPESPAGQDHLDPGETQLGSEMDSKRSGYHFCAEIGLELEVGSRAGAKTKLDLQLLTRAVLFEMHRYVEENCPRYVPALYEILDYNFDLSSQNHRKVELAWSVASQVIGMVGKHGRRGGYLNTVFQLPIEAPEPPGPVCKDEPQDGFGEPHLHDDDVVFVRKLKAVDIEVEIE